MQQLKTAILLSIVLFFSTFSSYAQVAGGKQQKLFDWFVLGDYEKCADRAMRMTENEKTKYESEPYLYVAICMLKIHDDPELATFYPDAIKTALKYGGKFKKRDDRLKSKELEYIFDQNIELIDELKSVGIREAKGYFSQNEYRKAVSWYKMVLKLDPEDPTSIMMKGVADIYSKNLREGQDFVDQGLEQFRAMAKEGSFEGNDYTVDAFEDAFVFYTRYLKDKGDRRGAQDIAKLARELAPENAKFERLQADVE